MKFTEILDLIQQVLDVTKSHWTANPFVLILDQVIQHFAAVLDSQLVTAKFEQVAKLAFGRIEDLDLVRNTSEERFVTQFAGFEIRGENQQLLERQPHLTP